MACHKKIKSFFLRTENNRQLGIVKCKQDHLMHRGMISSSVYWLSCFQQTVITYVRTETAGCETYGVT